METVIVPETPGVLAALGGLLADLRSDFVRVTFLDIMPATMPAIEQALAGLPRRRATGCMAARATRARRC